MNQAFDYNGVVVAQSAPKKVLRTVKKTIHIDSADRDTTKYHTNGDFWVYLPRNYQNIVSIRLKDAQFPPISVVQGLPVAISIANDSNSTLTVSGTAASGIIAGSKVLIQGNSNATNNKIFTVSSLTSGTIVVTGTLVAGTGGSVRLLVTSPSTSAYTHLYKDGLNITPNTPSQYVSDSAFSDYYFLIGLEGLNKVDETAVSADKSTFTDSFFAKIPATTETYGANSFIAYNDHSTLENIATYSPPIENLDRLHITVRTHAQQNKNGFLYWTTDGAVASSSNTGGSANFNLTLEVEYLENGFTDFSSFETRLAQRS